MAVRPAFVTWGRLRLRCSTRKQVHADIVAECKWLKPELLILPYWSLGSGAYCPNRFSLTGLTD